jgi:hypothetical protein
VPSAGPPPRGILPPHEILTIVRSTGLDPVGPPSRRGWQYMVPAVGDDGHELVILIDGRSGSILQMTSGAVAPRPPRGVPIGPAMGARMDDPDVEAGMPPGTRLGPYERAPGPGYITPPRNVYQAGPPVYQGGPGIHRTGPPVVYEDEDPRVVYGERPPAPVPNGAPPPPPAVVRGGPPPVIAATPADDLAAMEPGAGRAVGRPGALPPPPERFPQRVAPVTSAKPKPDKPKAEKKAAAAAPKPAPLPKPKSATGGASPAPAKTDAPAAAPEKKADQSAVPN